MLNWKRSHSCAAAITSVNDNPVVTLNGWVQRIRCHGQAHFIDLRDSSAMIQVVVDTNANPDLKEITATLKMECCIAVRGTVRRRTAAMINHNISSGKIELLAEQMKLLAACDTLPFMVNDNKASDTLRQRYRYLALRGDDLHRQIGFRHRCKKALVDYLSSQNFIEIETPTMIASTPEGARDYLIPSRQQKGSFYALPQSPQLYKQLLMVAGFERYYQFARCYRDEDSRGDRQPEFTQLDIEMSFIDQEDVLQLSERLLRHAAAECGIKLQNEPFPRLSYQQAIDRYGSDKPDLRYALELQSCDALAEQTDFPPFREAIAGSGTIKALVVPAAEINFSRKQIDEFDQEAKKAGASGLAWSRWDGGSFTGGIARFISGKQEEFCRHLQLGQSAALVLFVAGEWQQSCSALGSLRTKVAEILKLTAAQQFAGVWVVDFPLFAWCEELQCYQPAHHMFTCPQTEDLPYLSSDPARVKGQLYDFVLNGYEVASGSVRIHQPQLQQQVFDIIGYSDKLAQQRFGFLLEAFRFGPPPHGGIAFGFDRLLMILCQCQSIRDVIAFPKNNAAASLLDGSPMPVTDLQLQELALQIREKANDS